MSNAKESAFRGQAKKSPGLRPGTKTDHREAVLLPPRNATPILPGVDVAVLADASRYVATFSRSWGAHKTAGPALLDAVCDVIDASETVMDLIEIHEALTIAVAAVKRSLIDPSGNAAS